MYQLVVYNSDLKEETHTGIHICQNICTDIQGRRSCP